MIMKDDISGAMTPEDIALFADTATAVQAAIRKTVALHKRGNDPVLPIVIKGALLGVKGMLLEAGLQADGSIIPAFNEWVAVMKHETENAGEQCRAFENSRTFHGRA